jgi:DNA-binding NtrC family response regulator
MKNRVLVVDDEEVQAGIIADILTKQGYATDQRYSAEEALQSCSRERYGVILIDMKMPGMGGLGFLEQAVQLGLDSKIIIMTAYGTIENAVEAMRKGAFDYITKPFSSEELLIHVQRGFDAYKLADQNKALRETLQGMYQDQKFIGVSRAVESIHRLINKVSQSDSSNVLVTGESGTGKELVARAIHDRSGRSTGPFVPVNCSAIPENLLESELFGYVKGAFTGAVVNREGKFKRADGGTLFLDEIADMPMNMQVKLLRVIQDGEVTPVGGDESYTTDVRVIAATNRDIEREVGEGRFRDDLYFRLNVIHIHIPPLRERPEDIQYLVHHIVDKLNRKLKKNIREIPGELLQALESYHFPGNVRELENMLERAFIMSDGENLSMEHFPMLGPDSGGFASVDADPPGNLKTIGRQARRRAEREIIQSVLNRTRWNRVKAARILEVDYKTLRNKIKELNIQPTYFPGGGENE